MTTDMRQMTTNMRHMYNHRNSRTIAAVAAAVMALATACTDDLGLGQQSPWQGKGPADGTIVFTTADTPWGNSPADGTTRADGTAATGAQRVRELPLRQPDGTTTRGSLGQLVLECAMGESAPRVKSLNIDGDTKADGQQAAAITRGERKTAWAENDRFLVTCVTNGSLGSNRYQFTAKEAVLQSGTSPVNVGTNAAPQYEDHRIWKLDGAGIDQEWSQWPNLENVAQFFAWWPTDGTIQMDDTTHTFSYTVETLPRNQRDLLYSTSDKLNVMECEGLANLKFRHALTTVIFRGGQGVDMDLVGIALKNIRCTGTFNMETQTWQVSDSVTNYVLGDTLQATTGALRWHYVFDSSSSQWSYAMNGGAMTTCAEASPVLFDKDRSGNDLTLMLMPQQMADVDSEHPMQVVFYRAGNLPPYVATLTGTDAWEPGKTVIYTMAQSEPARISSSNVGWGDLYENDIHYRTPEIANLSVECWVKVSDGAGGYTKERRPFMVKDICFMTSDTRPSTDVTTMAMQNTINAQTGLSGQPTWTTVETNGSHRKTPADYYSGLSGNEAQWIASAGIMGFFKQGAAVDDDGTGANSLPTYREFYYNIGNHTMFTLPAYNSTTTGSMWSDYVAESGTLNWTVRVGHGTYVAYNHHSYALEQSNTKGVTYKLRQNTAKGGYNGNGVFDVNGAAKDLSNDGSQTANCYIINGPGTFSFPAVQGNSTDGVGTVASVTLNEEYLHNSYSSYMADDEHGYKVVDPAKIRYDAVNNRIIFSTYDNTQLEQGNAIITAWDNAGKPLWHWHIWATDLESWTTTYDSKKLVETQVTNLQGHQYTFYPIELGMLYTGGRDYFYGYYASIRLAIAKADGTEDTSVPEENRYCYARVYFSYGIRNTIYKVYVPVYRWGRPFPYCTEARKLYSRKDGIKFYPIQNLRVSEPAEGTLFTKASITANHWIATTSDQWTTGTDKTAHKSKYDPCPYGWVVPPAEAFNNLDGAAVTSTTVHGNVNESYLRYTQYGVPKGISLWKAGTWTSDNTTPASTSVYFYHDGSVAKSVSIDVNKTYGVRPVKYPLETNAVAATGSR